MAEPEFKGAFKQYIKSRWRVYLVLILFYIFFDLVGRDMSKESHGSPSWWEWLIIGGITIYLIVIFLPAIRDLWHIVFSRNKSRDVGSSEMSVSEFKGVFQQGDGTECTTEVKVRFIGETVTGTDKSEHGEWELQGVSGNGNIITGIYRKLGSSDVSGNFALQKTDNGYVGEYSGTMDDGSQFTGYYKWLNK